MAELSADGRPVYWLDRNFLSSTRLSYQHQIYTDRLGYLLHPYIISSLSLKSQPSDKSTAPVQILDLATGNGIWAIDLARELAGSPRPIDITGLDISDIMFPPRQTWPPNMTFATYDFFEDVPAEYVERFDVVHVRFIQAVIFKSTDARDRVIKNFTRMLKTGGCLQWTEPPPPMFAPVKFHDDGSVGLIREYHPAFEVINKYVPIMKNVEWMRQMDRVVEDVGGYVEVQAHWPELRKDKLKYENDLLQWNNMEAVEGMLKTVKDEAARKEIQDANAKQMEEIVKEKWCMGVT